ncbi:hypothetical protein [Streptomyces sp. NPDC055060]
MTDADNRSRAISLYLLGGGKPYPEVDREAVRKAFAPEEANRLIAYAAAVVAEMDTFEVDWSAHDLQSATRRYEEYVRTRHPELDASAVTALGRAYSFWWK